MFCLQSTGHQGTCFALLRQGIEIKGQKDAEKTFPDKVNGTLDARCFQFLQGKRFMMGIVGNNCWIYE